MENIGLQDSLLSRFDLLFIVLDQMDPEIDKEIADHVLRMHRYRAPGEQEGTGGVTISNQTSITTTSRILPSSSSKDGWWVLVRNMLIFCHNVS